MDDVRCWLNQSPWLCLATEESVRISLLFAAGIFAILVGAPVTFLGWLFQSRVIFWIGGALMLVGFFVADLRAEGRR